MPAFSQLVTLLRDAVADPGKLPVHVPQFQELVWHRTVTFPSPEAENAVRDLAYDLEYYVSDPNQRSEDSSYFGEDRAVQEIRAALDAIEKLK